MGTTDREKKNSCLRSKFLFILKILTFIYLDALGLSRGSWDLVP